MCLLNIRQTTLSLKTDLEGQTSKWDLLSIPLLIFVSPLLAPSSLVLLGHMTDRRAGCIKERTQWLDCNCNCVCSSTDVDSMIRGAVFGRCVACSGSRKHWHPVAEKRTGPETAVIQVDTCLLLQMFKQFSPEHARFQMLTLWSGVVWLTKTLTDWILYILHIFKAAFIDFFRPRVQQKASFTYYHLIKCWSLMSPLGSPLFHSAFFSFWEHAVCSCCLLLVFWEKFVCELTVKQRFIS